MILRDYQQAISDAVLKTFFKFLSTLIIVPTGAGKTVIFADIIRRFLPQRALVIAHREELIFQAKEKIERITGFKCDIEMADQMADVNPATRKQIVVTTIQTMCKRYKNVDPHEFGLIVIDECHHTVAKSYVEVLAHFRKDDDVRILGVTATPDRADKEALGKIFESVAFDYEILDCIHDGWLTPVEQQVVHVNDLDFSGIRTTCGDLNTGDLAAILENEKLLQGMIGSAIELISTRPTIFFAASVKHAEMAKDIFNRHREGMAAFVCGTTNKDERRDIMANFSKGEIQVLCNVGVATEGVDLPTTSVIIMGRPTKSRSLYAQMAGRGFRPLPGCVDGVPTPDERKAAIAASGKPSALILDYVGNAGRHKLITTADILGGKVSPRAIELAKLQAALSITPVPMSRLLDEIEAKLQAEAAEKKRQELEQKRLLEEARKARVIAKVDYSSHALSPFDKYRPASEATKRWDREHGRIISEKQRNFLRKEGFNPDTYSFKDACRLIGEIKNGPATARQREVLARYGYPTNCTRNAARLILDHLKANNWVRPLEEIEGMAV